MLGTKSKIALLFIAFFVLAASAYSASVNLDVKNFYREGDYYVKSEIANLGVGEKIQIFSGETLLYEITVLEINSGFFSTDIVLRVNPYAEGITSPVDHKLTFWIFFSRYNFDLTENLKISAKMDFWGRTLDFDKIMIKGLAAGTVPGNNPPKAINVSLTPSNPKDADDITCCFEYSDPEGDAAGIQRIEWLKDGKHFEDSAPARVEQFKFCSILSNTKTNKFEQWQCKAYPKANVGTTDGTPVESNKVTVEGEGTTIPPITTTPSGDPTIVSTLSGLAGIIDNKVGQYYRCLVAKTEAEAGVDCSELSGRVGECSNMLESMKSLEAKYPKINGYINYMEEVDTAVFDYPRETYLKTPANTPTYATMKPNLTRAMISVESSWQADKPAANDEGSYGIMQVSKSNLLGLGYPAAQKGQADIFTADKWKDPYDNIMRGITINNIHYYNYILPNTEGKCDNPVLKNTGIAGATFKEALGVAAYTAGQGVKCDYLAPAGSYDSVLRTTALKLAYYRIFSENYAKYKKGETICALQGLEVPPVEEIPPKLEPPTTGCGILCMLSYIDKAFVDQIFKSNK